MRQIYLLLLMTLVAILSFSLIAAEKKTISDGKATLGKTAIKGHSVVFDVNQISTYIRNNGSFNRDPLTGNSGFEWPKGTGNTAIYASGLWIGAKVGNDVRVATAEYSYEYIAGPILAGVNPADERWRIYKIKRGDNATNSKDYAEWPFNDGAPALRNFNNTADSLDDEGKKIPLMIGDMTIWGVFNDNNVALHNAGMLTAPLGVEVQLTAFGYNRSDALGNAIYYNWKVINKSGNQLDSAYISIWADPDLGVATDDYVGCDTLLGLGYCYNGAVTDGTYGVPPATGFDFLQGPIVPSIGDTARLPDGSVYPNKKILKMTSFVKYANSATSVMGDPQVGTEVYNFMKANDKTGVPIVDDWGNRVYFMYPGDPNSANSVTNWVEQRDASGDRRFMMTTGPFTMAPNDTQVIVGGNLIALGSSNTASVTALKNADKMVQKAYDLNFKLASPPPSPKVEVAPIENGVILTWGKDEALANRIESFENVDPIAAAGLASDSTYNFQGYVVYQFANASGDDPKIVATYDVVDNPKIGIIYDDVFNPTFGQYVNQPVKFGSDCGIKRTITIKTDAYTGAPLVNNKTYYFAVTAYTYNKESVPKTLESALNPIAVRPRQVLIGSSYSTSGTDSIGTKNPIASGRRTVPHTAGISQGFVIAKIVQPDSITGDTYEVRFNTGSSGTTWRLVNATKNIILDSNRTNMSDDEMHPIKDGIMFKVVDAPTQLAELYTIPSDPSKDWIWGNSTYGLHYMNGGLELGINAYDYIYYGWHPTLPFGDYVPVKVAIDTNNPGWVYRYRRLANAAGPGGYRMVFQNMIKAPIKAWDISNPASPRQLNVAFRDQLNIGTYDITNQYDLVAIAKSTYDSTGATYTSVPGGPMESDAMYIASFTAASGHTVYEASDTLVIVPYRVHTTADVFTINTADYKSTAGDVSIAKTQLNRINVVPNPYFCANAYERDQLHRVVRFTNLPKKATLRIFTLKGELIRTINKDNDDTDQDWDLTNKYDLPIASGMYIIHIDMGSIGTKVLKLAVIMAEERLDNF